MPADIGRVTVDGQEQDRAADLARRRRFEVETASGRRYVVRCDGPPIGTPADWDVFRAEHGRLVGRVHLLGAGMPGATTYRYRRAGAWFSGGRQFDLWNAVQSLLD